MTGRSVHFFCASRFLRCFLFFSASSFTSFNEVFNTDRRRSSAASRDRRRRSSVHQAAALLLHAALEEADGGWDRAGAGAGAGAGAALLPLRADDVVTLDKFKCNQVTTWLPLGLFSFHVVFLVAMLSGPPPPNRLPSHLTSSLPLLRFSPYVRFVLGDIIFDRWCATSSPTP
jgi:hypothetical protein